MNFLNSFFSELQSKLNFTQIVLLSIIGVAMVLSIVFMIMFLVEIAKKNKENNENVEEVVEETKSVFDYNEPTYKEQNGANNVTNINVMLASLDEQTKEEPKEEPVVEEEPKVEEKPVEVPVVTETVIIENGSVFDYKSRLEQIVASRDKVERDLAKVEKSVLKYERTKRRMSRNQKMLDRRAGELTNLNLIMYSVTDIKNVDEEKKAKQEELTAHIAELKASIQDAEEFIESNKEKNEQNIKMAKFLGKEKTRMNEEIAELEKLIKKAEEAENK